MSTSNNGTAKKIRISRKRRDEGHLGYFFEQGKVKSTTGQIIDLYELAKRYDEQEVFELDGMEPERQLGMIVSNINLRIKITQEEIFKIGRLLCKAKKLCQQEKIGFKKWIAEHFDFSYETANNMMNVHKCCFGRRRIVQEIPPSILYKITAPNFPDELREYLFEKGNFDKITNNELPKIKQKFEEGGIEAVEGDMEKINRTMLAARQINGRMDLTENYLRHLNQLRKKYRKKDQSDADFYGIEEVAGWLEPEATEITLDLYKAIEKAYEIVDEAYEEAKDKRNEFITEAEKLMK